MTFSVFPSNFTKTGAVVISLPLTQRPSVELMQLLVRGCPKDLGKAKPQGAELSAMLYALYQAVDFKINGAPSDAARTKMSTVTCDLQGRDFIITVTGPPNPTVVAKAINFAIKCAAAIHKMKSIYKKAMDRYGLRTVDEDFKVAADLASHGAKHMQIAVIGVKIPAEKEKAIAEKVKEWIGLIPAGSTAGKLSSGVEDTQLELHARGDKLGCLLLQHYLKAFRVDSHVVDGGVIPSLLPRQWPGIQKKLAGVAEKYVDAKFMKMGDRLGDALRVLAVRAGYFTPADLRELGDTPPRARLVASLKKILA